MPLSIRRLGPYAAAVTILVLISVITLVGLGEGFRVSSLKTDEPELGKRDGSNISLGMPGKSGQTEDSPNQFGVLKSIATTAEFIPETGSEISSPVQDNNNKMVSIGISKGFNALSIVASILNEASAMVNIVVSDVTTVVEGSGNSIGGYAVPTRVSSNSVTAARTTAGYTVPTTEPSNIPSFAPNTSATSELPAPSVNRSLTVLANMTKPLNASTHFSTTSLRGLNSANATLPKFTLNNTSLASQVNFTKSPTVALITPMLYPITTPCPGPITSTHLITETWHSTHYESTATLYSFMNAITITCTETMSICPQTDPYIFATNTTNTFAPSDTFHPCPDLGHPCPDCPGGVFCPPQQTPPQTGPCGLGWACAHCTDYWFCSSSSQTTPTNRTRDLYSFAPSMSLTNPLPQSASTLPVIVASGLPSLTIGAGIMSKLSFSSPASSLASLSSMGTGLGTFADQMNALTAFPSIELNSLGASGGGIIAPSIASIISAVLTLPKDQIQNGGLNGATVIPILLPSQSGIVVLSSLNSEPTSLLAIKGDGNIFSSVVSIATASRTPVVDNSLLALATVGNFPPSGNLLEIGGAGTTIISNAVSVTSEALGLLPIVTAVIQDNDMFQGTSTGSLSGVGGLKNVKFGVSDARNTPPPNIADMMSESVLLHGKDILSRFRKSAHTPSVDEDSAAVTLVVSRTVIPLPTLDTLQVSTTSVPTITPEFFDNVDVVSPTILASGNNLTPIPNDLSLPASNNLPGMPADLPYNTLPEVVSNLPAVPVSGHTTIPQPANIISGTLPTSSELPEAIGISGLDNLPTIERLPATANLASAGSLTGLLRALDGGNLGVRSTFRAEKKRKNIERFVQDYLTFCKENPEENICQEE